MSSGGNGTLVLAFLSYHHKESLLIHVEKRLWSMVFLELPPTQEDKTTRVWQHWCVPRHCSNGLFWHFLGTNESKHSLGLNSWQRFGRWRSMKLEASLWWRRLAATACFSRGIGSSFVMALWNRSHKRSILHYVWNQTSQRVFSLEIACMNSTRKALHLELLQTCHWFSRQSLTHPLLPLLCTKNISYHIK